MKTIIIYLLIINALAIVVMIADKHYSRNNHRRIPEINLFLVAIMGGSLGSLIGMYTARHKIKKKNFVYGMPAILVAHVLLFLLYIL